MHRRLQPFVLVLLAASLTSQGLAQDSVSAMVPSPTGMTGYQGNTGFGIVGGLNFSRLALGDGNALADAKKRTTFAGGVFVTLGIGDILAVQPEVLLTMKGTNAANPNQNFTTGDLTLNLDYIEIPLLVKGYIPTGNPNLKPNVFAGPAFAFLINCRVGEDVQSGTRSCGNGGPDVQDTDTSIMFGAGLDFIQRFTAQVRFDYGLNDIDADPGTANNRTLMLMIGYIFRL